MAERVQGEKDEAIVVVLLTRQKGEGVPFRVRSTHPLPSKGDVLSKV